jgi:hypothetical protein
MEKQDALNLKKRYLVWFYKTTKEALDKVERKFTQVEVDKFILAELKKLDKRGQVKKFIDEFKAYVHNKEKEGLALKFADQGTKPEYVFLELKLHAIEKAIVRELGRPALEEIRSLYEKEMTERILNSTEY